VRKRVVHQLRRTVAALVCFFAPIVSCVCPTYAGNIPPALPALNTVRVGHFPIALVVDERLARVFVVNDVDGTISVLDAVHGTVLRTIPLVPHQDLIAIDAQDHHIFASSYDGAGDMLLLDAATGIVLRVVAVGTRPHAIVVDEQAQRIFVTTQGGVSMLDAVSGTVVRTIHLKSDGEPGLAAVDEQRGHVFIEAGTSIYTLDARTAAVLGRAKVGSYTSAVAVAQRAGRVFVTDQKGAYYTLDARTGAVLKVVRGTRPLSGAAVDDQTGRVFVTSTGAYGMLDARTGSFLKVVPIGAYPFTTPAVDARRGHVLVISGNPRNHPGQTGGGVSVLDATTGVVQATIAVTLPPYEDTSTGLPPIAVAVDERAGRAFFTNAASDMVTVVDMTRV